MLCIFEVTPMAARRTATDRITNPKASVLTDPTRRPVACRAAAAALESERGQVSYQRLRGGEEGRVAGIHADHSLARHR
jgi:hypothetical protein